MLSIDSSKKATIAFARTISSGSKDALYSKKIELNFPVAVVPLRKVRVDSDSFAPFSEKPWPVLSARFFNDRFMLRKRPSLRVISDRNMVVFSSSLTCSTMSSVAPLRSSSCASFVVMNKIISDPVAVISLGASTSSLLLLPE